MTGERALSWSPEGAPRLAEAETAARPDWRAGGTGCRGLLGQQFLCCARRGSGSRNLVLGSSSTRVQPEELSFPALLACLATKDFLCVKDTNSLKKQTNKLLI